MDEAVLKAYGWGDIKIPPFTTPQTPEESKALEAFQDEVIDRLFALNAERAKAEQLAGASAAPKKGTKGKGKKAKQARAEDHGQLGLLGDRPKGSK
jgi:hypothetical protein